MIRIALVVALAGAGPVRAEIGIPGRAAAPVEAPAEVPCENTRDADNCSRVLACIGADGLWFDGRADGWNRGTLSGRMSDGTMCVGTWRYDWLGLTASAELRCEDGRSGRMRYTAQDPETGTGLAHGRMGDGAPVRAWTGRNALEFLTPEGERRAILPCEGGAIPIS